MTNEIVASAASIVARRSEAHLEAFLGSCVGVSLVDRRAGIGGLLHLLLPEPTGTDVPFRPETYATTGMPHFLRALTGAGALKERLEACVAGGALIGRISESDLLLDIGGRTVEVVQTYLERNNIPVIKSETGGYVGRKMSLNLRDWTTVIEPVWKAEHFSRADSETGKEIHIDEAIGEVKPIPQVALKILRMIEKEDYTIKEVGEEIRRDQVISGKILNLCNSAMMGLRNEVDSIDRALVVLGEKRLLKLVVSASVETLFPLSPQGYSLCKGGIFQHAFGTALVAQEVASFTGRAASDIAYTAGLLHDIGKIPLDQFVALNTPYFYRTIQEGDAELCEIERAKFGMDHTDAGRRLGTIWALPPSLIDAITYHHRPEESIEHEELVTLVYLADLLMSRFQIGNELERLDTTKLFHRLNRLGLTPNHIPILVDRIPRNIFQPTWPVSEG